LLQIAFFGAKPRDKVEHPMPASTLPISQVILKVASVCNLDCSYCYVYHKADTSWRDRPALMPEEIFDATLGRIRRHCRQTGQNSLRITFHGGEPCLLGARRFDVWCGRIRQALDGVASVDFGIQTNGTRLDDAWGDAFRRHAVDVSLSMDGPKELHDIHRVDHSGRGSYDIVKRGLEVLQAYSIPYGIMSVIPFGCDPLMVHRHFVSLGCKTITYILPNFTHDTIATVRDQHGSTPCADFLIPVFDDWWFNGTIDVCVRDLENIARIILGGSSAIETFGNRPPLYAFVETDGDIEGLDNLYVCRDRLTRIGLNVRKNDFREMLDSDTIHRQAIFEGMPLAHECMSCDERETCAGGYLPHRYSHDRGFDNPSVWCQDLLKLFAHLRMRLGVTVDETNAARQKLKSISFAHTASR
jgi:uncharacterized protein